VKGKCHEAFTHSAKKRNQRRFHRGEENVIEFAAAFYCMETKEGKLDSKLFGRKGEPSGGRGEKESAST